MYKLIVLDIDGTTVRNDKTVSKRTKEVIQKAIAQNVNVCLCTGRNVYNTLGVSKALGLKNPLVCIDGAVVYDPVNKKTIQEKYIPMDILREIVLELKKEDLYIEFCTFDKYYRHIAKKELEMYSYGGVPRNVKDKFKHYFINNTRYLKDVNGIYTNGKDVNLMLFAGNTLSIDRVKKILLEKNYENIVIRDDMWNEYIFVVAKDANKAHGARYLCNHFGCNLEEVIAIGDEMNDIDMIREAGLGIAMGNANERIKELAKHVTLTNEEDGVAAAIEKFVLN